MHHLLTHNDASNFIDGQGFSPLMKAAYFNQIEIAKALVEYDADVNLSHPNGHTALDIAMMKNSHDVASFLRGIHNSLPRFERPIFSPTHNSLLRSSRLVEVGMLESENRASEMNVLVTKESCHIPSKQDIELKLLQMCKNGTASIEQMATFKLQGINMDLIDDHGRTPLIISVMKSHTVLIKWLLVNGANVNAKDYDGCTPLMYAAQSGHVLIARLLLESKADRDLFNLKYLNAYDIAKEARRYNVLEILKF